MQAIPPSAFVDRLRALPHDDLVAFVADLWAASGWETDVDGPAVVAGRDGTTQRLLVLPAARLQRFRSAPETTGPVDLVVAPQAVADAGTLPRGTPEAPVVSSADLRNRLLYAIDADAGDRLAREHLGVPARSEGWEPREPAVLRGVRRLQEAADPADAPVSRRAALGAVGLSVVGGSAWVLAGSRSGSDDGAGGIDDDPGVSNGSVPDTASFVFERTEDGVRVVHDGGEPIAAGQLLVRSQGLGVPPEVAWSDVATVGPGDVVSEGDALVLPAADTFEVTVLVDRDGTTEILGEFRHGEQGEEGDDGIEFARPPLASFSFEYGFDERWLKITHEEGDPIRAAELFVRGTGFLWSPEYRWDEQTRYDANDPVTPGTSTTFFDVGADAVAHVVWDDGSIVAPRVQASFVGPDRPLDPTIDGVESDRYGPENAGYAADVRGSLEGLTAAWRLTDSSAYGQSVALGDGKAVVARSGGTVFARDAVDGAELWRARLSGGIGGTPTVAGGTVFVRQMGRAKVGLCALDLADGSVRWTRELPHHQLGRPTVADGTVVLPASGASGSGTGIVYAMSAAAGRSAWARDLGTFVVPMSAAVGDGTAYVVPSTGVVAYDLESGAPQWRFEPDDPAGRFWWPMVAGGTLVVCQFGADGDGVTALDREDGSVRWQARVAGIGTLPAVGNGDVYVGLPERGVRVLDGEDGTERWVADVGNPVQAVTASPDAVYVADENGTVHALSPEDGGSLFSVDTAGETVRSLVAHDDTLYLSGDEVAAYRVESATDG